MKNTFSIILAVCFALVSCAKQEPQAGSEGSGALDHITAVGPGGSLKTVVHDATKVFWTSEDKIGMYSDGGATAVYVTGLDEPSAVATFGRTSSNQPAKINDRYYAVYPSSAIARWDLKTSSEISVCYVNVPKQQTAVNGSWDKEAAILVASSQTSTLAFKHAVAYLRFEVTGQTGDFVSVRLSSNNKEKLSDSQAGLQLFSNGLGVVPGVTATDYVSLRNADTVFVGGAYYIALLPGEFTKGLTLTFTNADGLVAKQSVGALTLNPGDVSDWGEIPALSFTEAQASLEVATLYKENNINQGVVYWVNPDDPSKGKIVSASSTQPMDWSDGLIWTDKIESQEDGLLNYEQFNASETYTGQKERYYAMKYCEDMRSTHGGNWYLPAPLEIRTLFKVYYGLSEIPSTVGTDYRFEGGNLVSSVMAAKAEFDSALSLLEAAPAATLDGDANADGISDNAGYGDAAGVTYWTSKVNTGGAIQYVNIGIYNLNNTNKVAKQGYVRCVRDIDLNNIPEFNPDDPGDPSGGEQNPPVNEVSTDTDTLKEFDIFNMPRRVSLLGDSITSYEGTLVAYFSDSENGGAYYPTGTVTSVTDQYWYKLIHNKMSNAMLGANNSLRGSMVTRRMETGYEKKDYSARVAEYGLGAPNVILIHGGTNDCTKHSASYAYRPGLYRADLLLSDSFLAESFSDDARFVSNPAYESESYKGMAPESLPSDDDFNNVYAKAEAATTWNGILALEDRSFIHSYVKILNMIHFKYPDAKVVMIIPDCITGPCRQSLRKIGDHYGQKYGYKYVDFYIDGNSNPNISKVSGVHPDGAGFTYMANTIYQQVGSYIDQ